MQSLEFKPQYKKKNPVSSISMRNSPALRERERERERDRERERERRRERKRERE
jgi:hypothetical protein